MENMNNTNTNKNTNTNNTNKNKGEKKMKNIRIESIHENVVQARENLEKSVKKAMTVINSSAREKRSVSSKKITDALAVVKTDVSALNSLLALEYYKARTATEVITAGREVPSVNMVVTEDKEAGTVVVSTENVKVYPTLPGMVSAGIVEKCALDTVDLLRRVVAYLKGNTLALTGDVANKKDVPSEAVATLIKAQGDLSETKVVRIMTQAVREVTGGEFTKSIFPKVYQDFAEQVTKRGKDWGTRTCIGKSTANDLILEYLYMSVNGMTAFKIVID